MKFAHLLGPEQVKAWAKRLIDDLNRSIDQLAALPGGYSDDAAARDAGVPVGSFYVDTAGIVRKRLS